MEFTISTGLKVSVYVDDVCGEGWYMYIGEVEGKTVFAEHARKDWLTEKNDCAGNEFDISDEEYAEICQRIDETVAALALSVDGKIFKSNYYIDGHDVDNDAMGEMVSKVF
jgi:hypothetical protein|nr:MAG TPA: hypothetical protein [Caudoviricetes sp.]